MTLLERSEPSAAPSAANKTEVFGFYEFFAGGGMARLGLGPRWRCMFANDNCAKKAQAYKNRFGPSPEFLTDDIRNVSISQLPRPAVLSWASFPCQDLSLAGNGKGLKGERSGTFWSFWRLMEALHAEGCTMPLIVLENVVGALVSNQGRDFRTIVDSITSIGYKVGALVMDAVHFVPQSRPRLFLVAVSSDVRVPPTLLESDYRLPWHPARMVEAYNALLPSQKKNWLWWRLPYVTANAAQLSSVIENDDAVEWHIQAETRRLISMMSEANRDKVRAAMALGRRIVGTIYKRIRIDESGRKVQRAEVRFDQVSGCLRTPAGGSSRQIILVVNGRRVKSRLLTAREAARLMGVSDDYPLPHSYNEAYHLMGDGLVVPVVEWLEQHLLRPLAESALRSRVAAASCYEPTTDARCVSAVV